MQVNVPQVTPFSEVNVVGIAIKTVDSNALQNHIGLLYKFDSVVPHLLHLAWHKNLRADNQPNDSYLWLDLGEFFTDMDRAIICAHVKKVADANESNAIPYGFDAGGQLIDPETGCFRKNIKAVGLTCATFVLEVFESCGYKLVDLLSWQKNDKQAIKWQKQILKTLIEREQLSKELVERQTKNIGNRRYLPEEVAVATQADDIPVPRGQLKQKAKLLRDQLKKSASV